MVDWRNTRCWVMSQLLQLLQVYVAQVMIVAAPSAQKTKVTLRLARESRLVESQVGRDGFRGKTFARQFLVTCYYGRGGDGDRSSLKS